MRRPLVVVIGLAIAGLVMLSWTQTWFTVHLAARSAVVKTIAADGSTAVPQYTALAIASLALFLALTIAGPVLRVVLAGIEVLLGAAVAVTGIVAVADPIRAAQSAVGSVTGVSDLAGVRHVVTSVDTSGWPVLGIVAGVLAAALGVVVMVVQRAWPGPSRKYGPAGRTPVAAAAAPRDAIVDWDDLSAGVDPTDAHERGDGSDGPDGAVDPDRSADGEAVGLDPRRPTGPAPDHEEHREQH